MVLMILVIIGALNWMLVAFDCNLVECFANNINKLLKTNYRIDKVIYVIVACAAILLAIKKETWLPFLGWTILPTNLLDQKMPLEYDSKYEIKTEPNKKIVYWAAMGKNNPNQDVVNAYGNYENSGVTMSDANGNAVLYILAGEGYVTPYGIRKSKHIHYRLVMSNNSLGRVHTVYY